MSNHYNYILNFAILEGILYCKCSRWLGKVTKSPLLFLSALTQSNLCHSGRSQDIQKVEALEALYDTITDFSPFGTLSKSISGSSPCKSNIHFLHKPLASFRSLCWTSWPQLRHSVSSAMRGASPSSPVTSSSGVIRFSFCKMSWTYFSVCS